MKKVIALVLVLVLTLLSVSALATSQETKGQPSPQISIRDLIKTSVVHSLKLANGIVKISLRSIFSFGRMAR